MSIATVLLPDFSLILIGLVLMRITKWGNEFWAGLEKMVYFVLFPALLFYSTSRTPLDFSTTGKLIQCALLIVASGIALGWLAKPLFPVGPMSFESAVQTAFRFNSYIALAIAFRLGGESGTSMMALIIGFAVPLCNMAAVHALVHRSGGLARELAKNPLLIATACGVLFNLTGLPMPEVAGVVLSRMGNASIARCRPTSSPSSCWRCRPSHSCLAPGLRCRRFSCRSWSPSPPCPPPPAPTCWQPASAATGRWWPSSFQPARWCPS
jgi:predicted permease